MLAEQIFETEKVALGKYKTNSLVVLLLDKKTREIILEQEIRLGAKNLRSVVTHKNANYTVYQLNKVGFCEYNEPGSTYIVRYEYA